MAQHKIGRYEIRDQLGEGGMGTVYLAYDPTLGREVALKVLQPHLYMHDPDFSIRFEREAKAVASLEHGSIVSLYDFGEEGEWLYYVMRWMKGGNLKQRIARGPLSLDETVAILRRVGGAVDKAHSRGIVHRDIKPGNILFDEEGEAYLGDFGIIKMEDTSGLRTRTGQILGTPQYMSPEQLDGKEMDGRTDIYSLGVVLFEMLSGIRPYDHESEGRVIAMHYSQPVPNIAEANPGLPAGLQAIINKAMAKDPAERYATASALADAVAGIATGQRVPPPVPIPVPVPAPTPIVDEERAGGISKWVYALIALAVIIFLIIGGTAVANFIPRSGNGDESAAAGNINTGEGSDEGAETETRHETAVDPEAVAATDEAAIATAIAATVAADPESIVDADKTAIAEAVAATNAAELEAKAAAATAVAATESAAELRAMAAATDEAATAEAVASAKNAAELETRCLSASTWTPSRSSSVRTDDNNCWELSSLGIAMQEGDLIIDTARPSSEEINGIFSDIDRDVTIDFDVRVDQLTSPGDNILTNISFGILPSHLPQNFGHIYYQQESPQAGYPVFIKHKERGGFEEYMTLSGEYIRYSLGSVDHVTMSLVGDELTIFLNGSKVAGPIEIDFADRVFWIGYRLPEDGEIEARISNLSIRE